MLKLIKDIRDYRELLLMLVWRNIKIRYRDSALGFLWTLLNPVLLILIYVVFLGIMRFPISLPTLITGILAWQFLAMCMGDSLQVVAGNSTLVKKTAFPRIILPLSMVAANTVNFLLSLAVLLVYLVIIGASFGWAGLLPVVLATHFALCLGGALIVSAANVFFRDTEHIEQVIMLAWFFLTPIIYPLALPLGVLRERFAPALEAAVFLNPMVGIVSGYRMAFLSEDVVPGARLALSLAVSWVILAAGVILFRRVEGRFADEM